MSKTSTSHEASDRTLLKRFHGGDENAATTLYLRYVRRLQQLAKGQISQELASCVDPDDVVQSVFRTFFRRAGCGQYAIPEGEELWKLLLVIALNKVRAVANFHRAKKRTVRRTKSLFAPGNEFAVGDSDDEELAIVRMTVAELLAELPPPQPEMISLRIEGYDVAEIAQRTQRSKRTVERVLQSFRDRLAGVIFAEFPKLNVEKSEESGTR